MNLPLETALDLKTLSPTEIQKLSSLEYFHFLVEERQAEALGTWLRNSVPRYNGQEFGPITQARIETKFGTNAPVAILVKRGKNELKIPITDLDYDHGTMFSGLPKAPDEWQNNNPKSSLRKTSQEASKTEPAKEIKKGFGAIFRSIMEDVGLMRHPKAQKNVETPTKTTLEITTPQEPGVITEITTEPGIEENVAELPILGLVTTEPQPLTLEDLPEHLPELPPVDTIELMPQTDGAPEFTTLLERDTNSDISGLIQEGTATIVPLHKAGVAYKEEQLTEHNRPMSTTISTMIKYSIAASMLLSTPAHSTRSVPTKTISIPTPEPKKSDLQAKQESAPVTMEKPYLEETITPGTTIYSLSKKHNLGNNAWFQYRKYWRIKNADGSLTVPLDVRLPIGAKLIYSTENFPVQKSISKTIEPHYTIWQFCQDNALSEKYWQYPENFFRVQFPGKTELQTPDVYHLPIHGTLHFDKDGFEKEETREDTPLQTIPHTEKRVVPEAPKTILTKNLEENIEYNKRLNTPIGVLKAKDGEIFVAKTGSYTTGETVYYKDEACTVVGRSYNGGLILELVKHKAQFALKPESVTEFVTRDDTPINALI